MGLRKTYLISFVVKVVGAVYQLAHNSMFDIFLENFDVKIFMHADFLKLRAVLVIVLLIMFYRFWNWEQDVQSYGRCCYTIPSAGHYGQCFVKTLAKLLFRY